ncbi:tail protein X [Acinetobacter ursingii]|uniref:tail protein X n=1 Tax=Acinetobacter ursingii TaxID=108980 RepID=UPI000F6E2CDC|nr:tail protein X [Acinetobacter ursingii]BBF79273.1 hypothetical protein URS_3311 [Acinetobacter ursingii]
MATYLTKEGDTLDFIAYKYYGSTDNQQVEKILSANYKLSEYPAVLPEGVLIELPEQTRTPTISSKKVKLWD